MEKMDQAEISRFIYENVRLKTFPVGVKFFEDKDGLPEKCRQPSMFLKKRITICQAMTMARNYGWVMGLTASDVICVLASLAFGLAPSSEPAKEMSASFVESQYKRDRKKAVGEVGQMCLLESGEFEAISMGPLHKIPFVPDTIVLYGNPAQISRLIQAATYDMEEKIEGLFGGKVECPEYLIRPMKTGKPRVVIPGPGDRIFSMTADDEMIFAFPHSFLDSLALGLKESGKKLGARYPITVYQNFQPDFPENYHELSKRLGIS